MPRIAPKKDATKTVEKPAPAPTPEPVEFLDAEETTTQPSTAVVKHAFTAPAPVATLSAPGTGEKLPWLYFYNARQKVAGDVRKKHPGIAEGQPFVIEPTPGGNQYFLANDVLLFAAKEFFVESRYDGAQYETLRVSLTENREDRALERHIVAVVLAITPDGLIPTLCVATKAKATAFLQLASEIKDKGGDWRQVVATLRFSQRTSGKGFAYSVVTAEVRGPSVDEVRQLGHYLADPDEATLAQKVLAAWKSKCQELETMARGG